VTRSAVIVSVRVKADPGRAFDVFTTRIGEWWRASGLFQITPRGDGVLRFEPGENGRLVADLDSGKVYEIGRVIAWRPGEMLSFSWRPASLDPALATEVEARFEAIGGETRVTITHSGWAEIPSEHVVRHGFPAPEFQMRAGEWWRASLHELAATIGR